MATQPFTNLDFNNIKEKLKEYLKSQDRFMDYDFEGSNMNVLLDVLAYNTFQNNFYTNMAISEMFIDSAQIRDSVISHAKELNYLPHSKKSASAIINMEFFPTDNPASITIPARTSFNARCGTKLFKFTNPGAHVVRPNTDGDYLITGLEVFEGSYSEEFFEVTGLGTDRVIISNSDIDISSLRVFVKENEESVSETEYKFKRDLYDVESDDKVFYLQPHTGERYEIIFGQDVFGTQPENGNVIRVMYRRTVGDEANGVDSIVLAEAINNYSTNVVLVSGSRGGTDLEDIESIRYFAPRAIQIQERAVTEKDYEILLKQHFSEIRSVSVYGGERLNPPQYGRVVLSIYANDSENISEVRKNQYKRFISERTAVTIDPIIIPARFMYIGINSTVYYNINATNATEGAIENAVLATMLTYGSNNLEEFDNNFRFSRLTTDIDNTDRSILSNDTSIRAIIPISPIRNQSRFFILQFGNELKPDVTFTDTQLNSYVPCIRSSPFVFAGRTVYIQDNGTGRLDIVRAVNNSVSYVQKNIGAVNYQTGDVIIRSITIQNYTGSAINIYANLKSKNMTAPKDRILKIKLDDLKVKVVGKSV
jgi:hypothetical protein